MTIKIFFTIFLLILISSCGKKANLQELIVSGTSAIESGDIIIVSGGTVASTATPFPLHKVSLFSSSGTFKRFLYESTNASERLFGSDYDVLTGDLIFTADTTDRTLRIDLASFSTTVDIVDANLSGTTLRALAVLDDGSRLVAESTTSIEKYSAGGVRQGAPFPISVTATINSIKKISGNRFVVTFTGNPDNPRVYNADGTLAATFSNAACTTNCDPYDVEELSDGRFVMSGRTANAIYLFNSNFSYVGILYQNTAVIQQPSTLNQMANGNLLSCNTTFNTCEELQISGNTATRVGSRALIDNASAMRQPTSAVVIP